MTSRSKTRTPATKDRFVKPEEAIKAVKSGDRVFISTPAEPTVLIEALLAEKDRLENVNLISGLSFGPYTFLQEEYLETFHYSTWQISLQAAHFIRERKAHFLPVCYSLLPDLMAPGGPLAIDVCLVSLSPPDQEGHLSLGVSVGHALAAIKIAPVVLAEVNRKMPRTLGRCQVHISEIDYLVESDHHLFEVPPRQPTEVERRIGERLTSLVPDGATMQIGFGGLTNAIYGFLNDKKDLGVHSGMITDGIMALIEAGVITNSKKTLNPGRTVTGEMVGSRNLFDYVRENPAVEVQPPEYTHRPSVIGRLDNFCAINSAVEIDLTGQVNAESVDGLQLGAGGLFEFALGASLSPGGRCILALPSTAKHGKVSRIVSRLGAGVPVTIPRSLVHFVVTEFGVGDLRGRSIVERAELLSALAHPDFRNELRRGHSRELGD